METAKVGVREFCEQLGSSLVSSKPVAVTKHGQAVGFYFPVRRTSQVEDQEALRVAGRRLEAWMAERQVTKDELVADFERHSKTGRARGP